MSSASSARMVNRVQVSIFLLTASIVFFASLIKTGSGVTDEYRLLQDLFERKDGSYNPKVRPVQNLSTKITVGFELALIQLINLDEKNQIMKANVWLRFHWCDYELQWTPSDYSDIGIFRIQPDRVWKPDIVLLNNADGRFEVSFKANVLVSANGFVLWIPCTIYKSSCTIDVTYFPFDEQTCRLKFGSWTYKAEEVGFKWYLFTPNWTDVDISTYEPGGTWDLYDIPGEIITETHDNITKEFVIYTVRWRRKTQFYTVNLIIPCVLISSLSVVIFFLPSDAGEKVTLGVSILLALVVFLQVLVTNLLPPSSDSFPLFAKYLMLTVLIDVMAILNTIFIMNWNFKTPRTHGMPRWVRFVFFDVLPRVLCMKRDAGSSNGGAACAGGNTEPKSTGSSFTSHCSNTPLTTPDPGRRHALKPHELDLSDLHHPSCPHSTGLRHRGVGSEGGGRGGEGEDGKRMKEHEGHFVPVHLKPEMNKAVEAVRFIAAHLKNEDDYEEIIDDWRYVAHILDRILLIIYVVGTLSTLFSVLLYAPAIYKPAFDPEKYRNDSRKNHNECILKTNNHLYSCPWDEDQGEIPEDVRNYNCTHPATSAAGHFEFPEIMCAMLLWAAFHIRELFYNF